MCSGNRKKSLHRYNTTEAVLLATVYLHLKYLLLPLLLLINEVFVDLYGILVYFNYHYFDQDER